MKKYILLFIVSLFCYSCGIQMTMVDRPKGKHYKHRCVKPKNPIYGKMPAWY